MDNFPEDVIFDRADKIESSKKLRATHDCLEAKVVEFEARLKQITEESDQEGADRRLKRPRELGERLPWRIEEAENH